MNGSLSPAARLRDLDSGGSKCFYDSGTSLIHVRLVGDNNWVTLRR